MGESWSERAGGLIWKPTEAPEHEPTALERSATSSSARAIHTSEITGLCVADEYLTHKAPALIATPSLCETPLGFGRQAPCIAGCEVEGCGRAHQPSPCTAHDNAALKVVAFKQNTPP